MNIYAYKGDCPLGKEPCGSENRLILRDRKNAKAAIKTCRKNWGDNFKAYTFTNFFDDNTFVEIKKERYS